MPRVTPTAAHRLTRVTVSPPQGNLELALELHTRGLSIASSQSRLHRLAEQHGHRAECLSALGTHGASYFDLKQALLLEPTHEHAAHWRREHERLEGSTEMMAVRIQVLWRWKQTKREIRAVLKQRRAEELRLAKIAEVEEWVLLLGINDEEEAQLLREKVVEDCECGSKKKVLAYFQTEEHLQGRTASGRVILDAAAIDSLRLSKAGRRRLVAGLKELRNEMEAAEKMLAARRKRQSLAKQAKARAALGSAGSVRGSDSGRRPGSSGSVSGSVDTAGEVRSRKGSAASRPAGLDPRAVVVGAGTRPNSRGSVKSVSFLSSASGGAGDGQPTSKPAHGQAGQLTAAGARGGQDGPEDCATLADGTTVVFEPGDEVTLRQGLREKRGLSEHQLVEVTTVDPRFGLIVTRVSDGKQLKWFRQADLAPLSEASAAGAVTELLGRFPQLAEHRASARPPTRERLERSKRRGREVARKAQRDAKVKFGMMNPAEDGAFVRKELASRRPGTAEHEGVEKHTISLMVPVGSDAAGTTRVTQGATYGTSFHTGDVQAKARDALHDPSVQPAPQLLAGASERRPHTEYFDPVPEPEEERLVREAAEAEEAALLQDTVERGLCICHEEPCMCRPSAGAVREKREASEARVKGGLAMMMLGGKLTKKAAKTKAAMAEDAVVAAAAAEVERLKLAEIEDATKIGLCICLEKPCICRATAKELEEQGVKKARRQTAKVARGRFSAVKDAHNLQIDADFKTKQEHKASALELSAADKQDLQIGAMADRKAATHAAAHGLAMPTTPEGVAVSGSDAPPLYGSLEEKEWFAEHANQNGRPDTTDSMVLPQGDDLSASLITRAGL